MHNINAEYIYFPMGIPIPWEQHEILLEKSEEDELFYELDLKNPPPNSSITIAPQLNQMIIEEKNGNRAMMIPLNMVIAIGTKGSVLLPPRKAQ